MESSTTIGKASKKTNSSMNQSIPLIVKFEKNFIKSEADNKDGLIQKILNLSPSSNYQNTCVRRTNAGVSSFLDRLIPPTKNFNGIHNPFYVTNGKTTKLKKHDDITITPKPHKTIKKEDSSEINGYVKNNSLSRTTRSQAAAMKRKNSCEINGNLNKKRKRKHINNSSSN